MSSPPDPVVIGLTTTVILAVVMVLAYRWTISRQNTYAEIVRDNDLLFQRLADSLGLTFAPGRVIHHPVMGDVAAFGVTQGLYRGFHVTLRVTSDERVEPPVAFRTEIVIRARANTTFKKKPIDQRIQQQAQRLTVEPTVITFAPRVPCRARSMSYEFFVLTDDKALRPCIDMLCDFGEKTTREQDAS